MLTAEASVDAGRSPGPRSPLTAVYVLSAAKLALHLAFVGGYGYFRDELYYLACARHLAWGYVDHPPQSIAVLAAARGRFDDEWVTPYENHLVIYVCRHPRTALGVQWAERKHYD